MLRGVGLGRNSLRTAPLCYPTVVTLPALHAKHQHLRQFRATPKAKDILFISVPVKGFLLDVVRISLVALPFVYRYKIYKRFKKSTRAFLQIPLWAFLIVIALGLDQAPVTARWRLLLMSEREELNWSQERFVAIIEQAKEHILPQGDERVGVLKKVCDKLINSFVADQDSVISCARWPRDTDAVKERSARYEALARLQPTASTTTALLPFRPPSSNPEKVFEPTSNWNIFVLDKEEVNAYVLPSQDIFCTTGLLELVENREDFLAAILSHEIIHVSQRHAVENLGFMALSSVAFDILRGISFAFLVSFPYLSDALSSMFTFMNNTLAERAFSRKLELEADSLGLKLMARAGYDPQSSIELWRRLSALERETTDEKSFLSDVPLLRTHPCGEERLANLRAHIDEAAKVYKKQTQPHNWTVRAASQTSETASSPSAR